MSRTARILTMIVCLAALFTACGGGGGGGSIEVTLLNDDGGRVAWYKGPASHDRIAFDRIVDDTTKNTEIFTMLPDGTGITAVTQNITASSLIRGFIGQPEWHPDGQHIVFQVENSNSAHTRYNHLAWGIDQDLWIVGSDGSGAEMIYHPPSACGAALHPHFREDGAKIIFAERVPTGVIVPAFIGLTPCAENPWAGWQIHMADFDMAQTGENKLSNHVILFGGGLPANRGFFETHGFLPNGDIIYSHTSTGEAYVNDVFTAQLNISGSSVIGTVNLTNTPGVWDEHGLYSPSGGTLCFNSSRVNPAWQAPGSTALTLRTELYRDTGAGSPGQITSFNAQGLPDRRYLVSDFEWNRSGQRIVLQVAPVDDVTGAAYTPEIWLLTFPASQ